MRKFILSLSLLSLLIACNQNAEPTAKEQGDAIVSRLEFQLDSLKGEVIKIHDITMADLNTLAELRQDLKNSAPTTKNDSIKVRDGISDLNTAQDLMFDWMHNFKYAELVDASYGEKHDYLRAQRNKIQEIKDFTDDAMNKARLYTNDIKAKKTK